MNSIDVVPYASLKAEIFITEFPKSLGELETPEVITNLLSLDAQTPVIRQEEVRTSVRNMLREKGYKPTGRGKPASEYLVKAATEGKLSSINLAVDVCNAVSLASGLPISVVDLACVEGKLRVDVAQEGSEYIFNASGQTIRCGGLLCLADDCGPCGNAVKDSQRTKTSGQTMRTLTVVWGVSSHASHVAKTVNWYKNLLKKCGCEVEDVPQLNHTDA